MQVADAMVKSVVTVPPETTIEEAVATMMDNRIGSVLVVDHGPIGIMTRSDVLRLLLERDDSLSDMRVPEAMSEDPVTISPDASVETALRTMEEHKIKKLPVIAGLELVGIVTMTDLARHLPDRVMEARAAVEKRPDWTR